MPFPHGFCRLADSKIIFLYLTPEAHPKAVYSIGSLNREELERLYKLKSIAEKFSTSTEGIEYFINKGYTEDNFLRQEAQTLRRFKNRSNYTKYPNLIGFMIRQEALKIDFATGIYKKYMNSRHTGPILISSGTRMP